MVFRTNGDCYVVFRGRIPGIYPTWEAAEQQVTGFPGNLHRRYHSYEAGLNAWIAYHGGMSAESSFGGGDVAGLDVNHLPCLEMARWAPFPPVGLESQHGSSSHPSPANQPEFQHQLGNESVTIRKLVEAVGSLQTRVARLETEKWELFIQIGEIIEKLSTVFKMKDQKD